MRITKGLKFSHQEFGTKNYEIELSHQELGLPDPTSPEEAREVERALNYHAEMLRTIEEVKQGLVPATAIRERLEAWKPPQTSSPTEQG